MAKIDKLKINGIVYDLVPNTTEEQVNAKKYGLTYIHMRSGEQVTVDLISINNGGGD